MKKTFLIILILILFASCENPPSTDFTYQQPQNMGDGFEVGALNEVDID